MKISLITLFLTLIFVLSGCEKFLEIDPPADRLVTSTVFSSDATAISAMTGIYSSMMRSTFPAPYNITFYCGLYTDELDYHQSQPLITAIYRYGLNPIDAPTNSIWTNGYNFIYQANSILEGLDKSQRITPPVKKQITGEAYFVRAFWYFYLVNFYGDIPLSLTTDYTSNSRLAKSPTTKVYERIEQDLINARSLLSEYYVGSNSVTETPDRIRPNSFAASALLSRFYLQQKQWKKAKDEASIIINNATYGLEPIDKVFKRDSREVIWQLELPAATSFYNTYEANYFVLSNKPSATSNFRNSTISDDLFKQFDSSDLRRSAWIHSYKDTKVTPAVSYNYPSKYTSKTSDLIDEYTTCIRLAEMYLIRAEASTNLSQITEGVDDVDKIKERAGVEAIKDKNPDISKDELLQEILLERRKELFCEWGIRWMDIKRYPITDELMEIISLHKSATWHPYFKFWPIPLNEVLNNNNLTQNEGYQ